MEVDKCTAACEASNAASLSAAERGPNMKCDDWFCAIEALLSDPAKSKMIPSQECLTRQELDARKSAMAVEDCLEVASNLFNNSTWIRWTTPMPDLHPELAESRSLPLKDCRMTRSKMKEKHDSLKKRLHTMIVNYEKSGNCGGQCAETSPDWGKFDLDETFDGDNRDSFCQTAMMAG